jgi:hypothetical protein
MAWKGVSKFGLLNCDPATYQNEQSQWLCAPWCFWLSEDITHQVLVRWEPLGICSMQCSSKCVPENPLELPPEISRRKKGAIVWVEMSFSLLWILLVEIWIHLVHKIWMPHNPIIPFVNETLSTQVK